MLKILQVRHFWITLETLDWGTCDSSLVRLRGMRRFGFTLIELLVVIAIIAIIAAILFPVFAQAKVAAKGTAALSNSKQIGTAMMIYSADYDDKAVLVGRLDAAAPVSYGGPNVYPWAWLMQPYAKSKAIFQDPMVSAEGPYEILSREETWLYHTQFGYAYTIHSPWQGSFQNDGAFPISQTDLAFPAETVLLVTKKTRNGQPDWLVPYTALWGANLVNPPFCISLETGTNPNSRCIPQQRWGNNTPSYAGQSFEEGGLTGGVAFRKTGKACVVWADGHASWKSAEQLAAGTTWRKDVPFNQVQISEPAKYLWDMD